MLSGEPVYQSLVNSSSAFATGADDSGNKVDFADNTPITLSMAAPSALVNPSWTSCGKNLFNPAVGSVTVNGVTCTVAVDQSITMNGTATKGFPIRFGHDLSANYAGASDEILFQTILGKCYTLSRTLISGSLSNGILEAFTYSGNSSFVDLTSAIVSQKWTSTGQPVTNYEFWVPNGIVFNNYTFKLQLEQSTAPTPWVQAKSSNLAVTASLAAGDTLTYDGTTVYKNGVAVPHTGSLIAYAGGQISASAASGTLPSITYRYLISCGSIVPNGISTEGSNIDAYTSLITSEHCNEPKFMAWLTSALNVILDVQKFLANLYTYYDIDTAVGAQLDVIGQYLDTTRIVPWQTMVDTGDNPPFVWNAPATGEGGWKVGYWQSSKKTSVLNDFYYRMLLKIVIAKAKWDGSTASLENILQDVFADTNISFFIDDTQDMSFTINFNGVFTAMLRDLLRHDMLVPRPEGVNVKIEISTGAVIYSGGTAATTTYQMIINGGNAATTDYNKIYKYSE